MPDSNGLTEDWLRSKFDRHAAIVIGGIVLAIIGAAEVIQHILLWIGFFSFVMHKAVILEQPGPSTSFHVQGWLFWIFAGLLALALAAGGLTVQREFKLRQSRTQLQLTLREKK
jgi:hypothetical protein